MPVMSDGMRSGVNWIRLKEMESNRARLEIMSVFARPGTPSRMQCPLQKIAMRSRSSTSSWPTITRPSDWTIRRCAVATASAAPATAVERASAVVLTGDSSARWRGAERRTPGRQCPTGSPGSQPAHIGPRQRQARQAAMKPSAAARTSCAVFPGR